MSAPVPPRASPYRAPLLLGLLSLAGLISALVGDGVFDAVSWVAFAIVFATLVAMPLLRRRPAKRLR